MPDVGEKFWVFIHNDGESIQLWGYLTEAISLYCDKYGTMDRVVAIVCH